ncbi:MAG: thiamine pyrophosphate-binding protein [Sulfuricurvum sp.]
MTKLSDYVIDFLSKLNVKHVFVIQGGAVAHLIDSIEKNSSIEYITCQHEQACAMAADAYSKTGNAIGVAMATSGPGATNLITGIANAYYDSIPVIYITGNVASFRQSNGMGIRQYGFQETNIIDIVQSITKYCVAIKNPNDIKYELEKAFFEAENGRKGPVLIDIPDDFQREYIDVNNLKSFLENDENQRMDNGFDEDFIYNCIKNSKRPVLIYGSGVLSSNSLALAKEITQKLNIPTLFSWPLKGMFDYDYDLNFGSFGTNSLRSGNFIVQNSDLIISIGHRLDTHSTGSLNDFAREAKTVVVDIDDNELKKFDTLGRKFDRTICMDSKVFLQKLNNIEYKFSQQEWIVYCQEIKRKYYKDNFEKTDKVSPGLFFEKLSQLCSNNTIFIGDTGANLAYLFNGIKEKSGQTFISAFNNTPMGYALPASIGVALSSNRRVICCIGDGGMQMNIQELATIRYYNLPITIIVFNNIGHGMIKQTQDDWFDSVYSASSNKRGIPSLNFSHIANAYEIESIRIECNDQIDYILANLTYDKPFLIELNIDENLRVNPMLKFGRPLEDMNPLLDREEFLDNMIIEPLEISKKYKI